MMIGQVLQAPGTTAKTYYGPWMPAEGNMAVVTCDVVATGNLSTFVVYVETKNSEDSDNGFSYPYRGNGAGGSGNSITLAAADLTSFEVGAPLSDTTNAGFKELYRYRYVLTPSSGNAFVQFRMINTSWLAN